MQSEKAPKTVSWKYRKNSMTDYELEGTLEIPTQMLLIRLVLPTTPTPLHPTQGQKTATHSVKASLLPAHQKTSSGGVSEKPTKNPSTTTTICISLTTPCMLAKWHKVKKPLSPIILSPYLKVIFSFLSPFSCTPPNLFMPHT